MGEWGMIEDDDYIGIRNIYNNEFHFIKGNLIYIFFVNERITIAGGKAIKRFSDDVCIVGFHATGFFDMTGVLLGVFL